MTKLNRTITIFFLVFTCLFSVHRMEAQQYPLITQYMLNRYALNPAFGGLEQSLSVTASLRSQWSQFEGAPKTQMINAHLPLYIIGGSVGMAIENEQLGATKRTLATASYNYVYDSQYGLFSLGFKAGVQQIRLVSGDLRTPTGSYFDQSIDHRDPILTDVGVNGLAPVWGLGFYYVRDFFELGLSWDNIGNSSIAGSTHYQSTDLIGLFISYEYQINELLSVSPSALVKTDMVQTQIEFGGLVNYSNYFGGLTIRGLGGNSLDAVNIIVGSKISEHLRVAYSFDLGLSGLRTFHEGTHEFGVNYNLNKKIRTGELPRIIYNPRYN